MKRHLLWMLICLALPAALAAQQAHPSVGNSDRMFFPGDMFWGYGQFDLAPPHNEIGPNLRRWDARRLDGVEGTRQAAPGDLIQCTPFSSHSALTQGYAPFRAVRARMR